MKFYSTIKLSFIIIKIPSHSLSHSAFLGSCIECCLGKPLELGPYFWESTVENPGWKNIQAWFVSANDYPIVNYVPAHSNAINQGLYIGYVACQKEYISFVDTDDDLRYTVLSLELLEQKNLTLQVTTWENYGVSVYRINIGAYLGDDAISDHWKKPLHDTFCSMLVGTHPIAISTIAQRYFVLYQTWQYHVDFLD